MQSYSIITRGRSSSIKIFPYDVIPDARYLLREMKNIYNILEKLVIDMKKYEDKYRNYDINKMYRDLDGFRIILFTIIYKPLLREILDCCNEIENIRKEIGKKLRLFGDPLDESCLFFCIYYGNVIIETIYKDIKNEYDNLTVPMDLNPYFSTLLKCMKLIIEKDENYAKELEREIHGLPSDQRYLVKLTLRTYKNIKISNKNQLKEMIFDVFKNKEISLSKFQTLINILQQKIAKTERIMRKSKNPENIFLWKLNREFTRIFTEIKKDIIESITLKIIIKAFENDLRFKLCLYIGLEEYYDEINKISKRNF